MKITATIQEAISAKPTIQKMLPAYSPAVDLAKPTGHEADDGDQRAGEHGRRRVAPGIGRGLGALEAFLQLHHHHLDGDDGVIDQQTERDDERSQRDPVERASGVEHDDEDHGQRQRHGRRDHDADAPAEADQTDDHDHAEGDEELEHELIDGLTNVDRLIGDLGEGEAGGQLRR